MRVFETIKAAVTLRQAAEHYGLRVLPNGMTCWLSRMIFIPFSATQAPLFQSELCPEWQSGQSRSVPSARTIA